MAHLQSSAPRDAADQPATPAQESHQTRSADLLPATVTSSSEDNYALLITESKHFSEEEVQIESSRRVYMASPLRVPSQNYTRKKKKKSSSSRVSWTSNTEPASRLRRDEDDREEHAMSLPNCIRDANAPATSSSGAVHHDK